MIMFYIKVHVVANEIVSVNVIQSECNIQVLDINVIGILY